MTNDKYIIKDSEIIKGNEIKITIECDSDEVKTFEKQVYVPYNTTINDILDRINLTAYDEIKSVKDKKRKQNKNEKAEKAKKDACNFLKKEIDAKRNKETTITKPEYPS